MLNGLPPGGGIEIKDGGSVYELTADLVDNAGIPGVPTLIKKAILKECKDSWFQLFKPGGKEKSFLRVHPRFITDHKVVLKKKK